MPGVTMRDAVEKLGLKVLSNEEGLATEITGAVVCDLLSYVMAAAKSGNLWLTVQTHTNVVAVAQLTHSAGVLLTSGFEPDEETLARAEEESVTLLSSELPSYLLAGRLYEIGVR
jgi:predicted transcriptional regulator